jgi:hypothetical protein
MGKMRDLYDDFMERFDGLGQSFITLAGVAFFVLFATGIASIFWVGPAFLGTR